MNKLKRFLPVLIFLLCACAENSTVNGELAIATAPKRGYQIHHLQAPALDVSALPKAKNVILLIGDGMGLGQLTVALYSNGNKLNIENFPIVGLQKPYASNDLITDSAAAATAFSSGVKTYNGAIGVDPDTVAVKTILEEANENGLGTGLIATSSIVHATPASFVAHQSSREFYEEIAADFLKSDIDLFIGGGKKYFAQRITDDRDLYAELRQKGFLVSDYSTKDLDKLNLINSKKLAYFTANGEPLPVAQGRDYLQLATVLGITFLKRNHPNGFFLMVEGSQIDWGGHENSQDYIVSEMLDFDQMVGEVLKFAESDGQTLVIITADHETGGLSINFGSQMDSLSTSFSTNLHTGTLIPVFAYGPSAELFAGIYENTAIHQKMRQAIGFDANIK